MPSSKLRSQVPGPVSVEVGSVTEDSDRQAVILTIHDEDNHGALTHEAGLTIAEAAQTALDKRLPLVGYISSVGADINSGISGVCGWGTAAKKLVECSGIVPIIFCTYGPAVSGPALLLGIADIAIMLNDSYAFVSGPAVVRQFTGVGISTSQLGGMSCHESKSGVSSLTAPDLESAKQLIAEILEMLPPHTDSQPPILHTSDPANREAPELETILPDNPAGGYDIREILRAVSDDRYILELKSEWASNIVTALASIDGRPVGILANQPQVLAGTLDILASQKGASFVNFIDSQNLPILTFVDTPGFQPGRDQEWRGMIRHGAQLAFAYARASVPRICITIRKSYGGAYIVMDSKNMGNDIALAWPTAEIAVMGAKGAVGILNRSAEASEKERLEHAYAETYLNPYKAAERGSIDQVIAPKDTRAIIARSLDLLSTKREEIPIRRHDNTPL